MLNVFHHRAAKRLANRDRSANPVNDIETELSTPGGYHIPFTPTRRRNREEMGSPLRRTPANPGINATRAQQRETATTIANQLDLNHQTRERLFMIASVSAPVISQDHAELFYPQAEIRFILLYLVALVLMVLTSMAKTQEENIDYTKMHWYKVWSIFILSA